MGKCIENKDRGCLYGSVLFLGPPTGPERSQYFILEEANEGTCALVKLSHTENGSVSFQRKEVPENDGKGRARENWKNGSTQKKDMRTLHSALYTV